MLMGVGQSIRDLSAVTDNAVEGQPARADQEVEWKALHALHRDVRHALAIADFAGTLALDRHIQRFIARWNEVAHPFNWTTGSIATVMAKCNLAEGLAVAS